MFLAVSVGVLSKGTCTHRYSDTHDLSFVYTNNASSEAGLQLPRHGAFLASVNGSNVFTFISARGLLPTLTLVGACTCAEHQPQLLDLSTCMMLRHVVVVGSWFRLHALKTM